LELVLENIIAIFRSNYSFCIVFFVYFLTNGKYGKLSKELVEDLAPDLTSKSEILDMIKKESKKGNAKAKLALLCYQIARVCFWILLCMIFLWTV
jgi:hypothetical protein